jgi:hypothetical protein
MRAKAVSEAFRGRGKSAMREVKKYRYFTEGDDGKGFFATPTYIDEHEVEQEDELMKKAQKLIQLCGAKPTAGSSLLRDSRFRRFETRRDLFDKDWNVVKLEVDVISSIDEYKWRQHLLATPPLSRR